MIQTLQNVHRSYSFFKCATYYQCSHFQTWLYAVSERFKKNASMYPTSAIIRKYSEMWCGTGSFRENTFMSSSARKTSFSSVTIFIVYVSQQVQEPIISIPSASIQYMIYSVRLIYGSPSEIRTCIIDCFSVDERNQKWTNLLSVLKFVSFSCSFAAVDAKTLAQLWAILQG